MNFLNKDVPIEKLRGRTRAINTPASSIGIGKILGYSNRAIKMKIIQSTRGENKDKMVFISGPTFFMNLSEEQINNYNADLPSINLPSNVKLYEKK